ncbi:MAG TPA: hypothetical protein DDX91_01860 [Ruminococcaceae bacterium]|nr:hypothetical protein [Oscillospiraceae bacterium]
MAYGKDRSKLYIGILIGFILLLAAAVIFVLLIQPALYEDECRTRVYEDIEGKLLEYDVMSANICVVKCDETEENGSVKHLSYSLGSSGIIYKKEQAGKYYALTACHVVADARRNTRFLIQPYGTLSYRQTKENGRSLSLEEYYAQFPSANVEYCDESCDLAVISFYSPSKLGVLDIAQSDAQKDTKIAVISNPEGEKFIRTFGCITSDSPVIFSGNDGKSANTTIQHNAYVAPGSSGSGVLSFDSGKAEIVGINIGGGTNFMGKFQYGVMIPSHQISNFLEKMIAEQRGHSKVYR